MKIIGLTGGIASGKSTVSKYLAKKGIPIVDADKVARAVVVPGGQLMTELIENFGTVIIEADGTLKRKALGAIVFNDEQALVKLNKIMDPYIRKMIFEQLDVLKAQGIKLAIVDAPTLFEAGYQDSMDKIVVVYVNPTIQLERLMLRDNLSQLEAKQRIDAQISMDDKLRRANYVIDNQGDIQNTYTQVEQLLVTLKSLS